MKRFFLFLFSVSLSGGLMTAQVINPVSWELSVRNVDSENVRLMFRARITSPWHMYGLNIPDGGPIPTTIHFHDASGFIVAARPDQTPEPEIVNDPIFNMTLELHSNEVTFSQMIRKTSTDSILISGTLEYMTCSDMQCVLGDHDFIFRLPGLDKTVSATSVPGVVAVQESSGNMGTMTATGDSAADDVNPATVIATVMSQTPGDSSSGSLTGILLLSMLAGLGGLLTPCVYPMIPMTVSYFLRDTKSRSGAISQALVFGLSMVFIYTLIGVLVAVLKNPNTINNFTTHWAVNLIFFLIFIVLAASFFGMFEIILPSGLANKVDRQADKRGYMGAFFMALAMVILSFSCTGPIVASLLIKASTGEVLEPVIGMAGFSIIFALPFTLFAMFPSWLKNLPKSGGWLNSIKVFFAFIMLAFSFYFLSKIDLAYHLNIFNRELFISIWVVIFIMLGFYLLGKIRFVHDSELSFIGVPRLMISLASFAFALYLLTGLMGNELKGLSTIIPPPGKSPVSVISSDNAGLPTAKVSEGLCTTPKYSDFLSLPYGLAGYFDYDEAIACAHQQSKPVLVDFAGHTCSNCKKMYAQVWSDPRVLDILRKDYIIASLYTDDKTRLPESEWITSDIDGKIKNTIGKVNQHIQITRFGSNALPLYAIVDAEGNDLTRSYYSYGTDVDDFIQWLEEGLETMKALQDRSMSMTP
ncbi:MAG: thioredoxin family protein [Bacteroidales bacterium]|nr:thioredoxin family protein [Bacteroidales bacterium]